MSVLQLVVVAVNAPISELTYLQNDEFAVARGDVVRVPLRSSEGIGLVTQLKTATQDEVDALGYKLKKIKARDHNLPHLNETYLKWLEWIADYYFFPLGLLLDYCLPKLEKTTKARKSQRPPVVPKIENSIKHELNSEQQNCVDQVLSNSGFNTFLLHGVTGSGKTEVYLELFEHILNNGKSGLFLLPEISLTPQLVRRFAERFGEQIAVLHSQLTDRERTNQWWEIAEGKKKILVGARSALFCPIENLDLIVVDEEHESSFKQDADLDLKYNGRDCAIMLGYLHKCPVILGSATPSLESWKNALDKKYILLQLKNRVGSRPLPEIEVVDMRVEKEQTGTYTDKPDWLSKKLYLEMLESLERKEQVALLLNRRGLAQMVFCPACGHSVQCPNCDISLSLHAHSHLVCHYCDYHQNFKATCPDCKEGELVNLGLGTEKVEEDLKRLFPEARVARADRDEIQTRLEMEELIQNMEDQQIDILIGTQMIAKGLDFTHLKLVGLLLADISFNLPDFRSSERSFQLITQMSGRSGRHVLEGESAGKVIIQTYNTEHESIVFSQKQDYQGFADQELQNRASLNYPPFHKLVSVRIQSMQLELVKTTSDQLVERALKLKNSFPVFQEIEILGPAPAPISKLKNLFRYHILLKAPQPKVLNEYIRKLTYNTNWVPKQTKVVVDVDPLNLL